MDAIRTGQDAHMKSASLIWKDEWESLAEPGCIHLTTGIKCECPEHNRLRKISKSITFGLNYGISAVGLSDDMNITKSEAAVLMERFFETFPKIKQFGLDAEAEATAPNYDSDGTPHYHIVGMEPTRRIRFFHPPEHSSDLGKIGRQGKNYKIQSCNADMVKIALINLRQRIIDEDLPVCINLSVHDQIICSARRDVAEYWKTIQEEELTAAADIFLEEGLLGADTMITEMWCK